MRKNIIILGPPGSGKGTQAKILARKLNLIYFGTGDLMRQEAEKGTALGEKIAEFWRENPAGLLPEELVDELVTLKLSQIDKDKGVVFDGYPRTLQQAEALGALIDFSNTLVLNIKVSSESLVKRMASRRVCERCQRIFPSPPKELQKCSDCGGQLIHRPDDRVEVIRERITVYEAQTRPLIVYFQNKGILKDIDGEPAIEAVEKEIWEKSHGN